MVKILDECQVYSMAEISSRRALGARYGLVEPCRNNWSFIHTFVSGLLFNVFTSVLPF